VEHALDDVVRTQVYDALEGTFLGRYDIVISPKPWPCPPVANASGRQYAGSSEIKTARRSIFVLCVAVVGVPPTPPADRLVADLSDQCPGHPAIRLPAGLDERRVPVGLRLSGRRHADENRFGAAAAFKG